MSFAAAAGIEARMQDDLGPEPQAEHQDHRKRVDVEERQDAERYAPCPPPARSGSVRVAVSAYCAQAAVRLAWVSIAPLGKPVVPPVYWMTASASRGSPSVDGGIAPVVVEKVAERDDALVGPDLRQHVLRRHERLHRPGREREFGELADDEPLQPRRVEKLLRLRIERGDVEGDEHVRLAVLDLEFERAQRVERRIIDDHAARLQDAEKGDRVMGRVRQIEADMHAGPDAELLEARGRAVGERVELGVADPLVHELQRRKRAEPLRRLAENAVHGAAVSIGASQRTPAG